MKAPNYRKGSSKSEAAATSSKAAVVDLWHCLAFGEQGAPISAEALRRLVEDGRVAAAELVRRTDQGEWQPIQRVFPEWRLPAILTNTTTIAGPSAGEDGTPDQSTLAPEPGKPEPTKQVEPSSSDAWHYACDGKKAGPVPADTLLRLMASGEVAVTDLAWRKGMPNWLPVAETELMSRLNGAVSAARDAHVAATSTTRDRSDSPRKLQSAKRSQPAPNQSVKPAARLVVGVVVGLVVMMVTGWPNLRSLVFSGSQEAAARAFMNRVIESNRRAGDKIDARGEWLTDIRSMGHPLDEKLGYFSYSENDLLPLMMASEARFVGTCEPNTPVKSTSSFESWTAEGYVFDVVCSDGVGRHRMILYMNVDGPYRGKVQHARPTILN